MPLHKANAAHAIKQNIAEPLVLSVIEAAALIRRIVGEHMASAIKREIHLRGYHPEEFVLFATGGAGPTHAEVYQGDIPQAIVFPESPVFCAYGQSGMDILHVYEKSRRLVFMEPVSGRYNTDYDVFNTTVGELLELAKRDLDGEGFPADGAQFSLELDMMYGGQVQLKRMSSPLLEVHSEADMARIYEAFEAEFSHAFSPMARIYEAFEAEFSHAFSPLIVNRPGGVFLDNFVLKTSIPVERFTVPEYPLSGPDPTAARKGERLVYWPVAGDMVATAIFDFDRLEPGNLVRGPAVIESPYTTIPLPEGRGFYMDSRRLGTIEALDAATARTAAAG
jgi:N-methylhydantoinase A/acetophenone carboxylase